MIHLTTQNGVAYLHKVLPIIAPFDSTSKILTFTEITEHTYVNYIFKAEIVTRGKTQIVYLRQTRDHVKTKPDKKVEKERIQFEVKILTLLESILKGIVPEVLYLDKKNNIAILSDIKRNAPLLVNELVAGRAHPECGRYFGRILATFHAKTLGIRHELVRGSKKKNDNAIDFHLGMRLEPALTYFPSQTKQLLRESAHTAHCLVFGDLASKNIFVDKNKVRILDLERVFVWDPAFDLAFLFCHFLIEISPEHLHDSLSFIKNFMKSYVRKMDFSRDEERAFQKRVLRYCGVTILYRLFGFYLVINLDRDSEKWKKIASKLLKDTSSESIYAVLRKLIFI